MSQSNKSIFARTNFRGAAACGFAIGSAGAAVRYFQLLLHYEEYMSDYPHSVSGGVAFVINVGSILGVLIVLGLGAVALRLLLTSLSEARRERRPTATVVHVGAGLFLMPVIGVFSLIVLRKLGGA